MQTIPKYNIATADRQDKPEPVLQLIEPEPEGSEASNPAHPGITGGMSASDDPLFDDTGARIENSELYQSYLLIQNVLYHSWMELKRKSTQKAEAEFWRSRRADFFVYLANLHRECMNMEPIHADRYRRGIATALDMPSDWIMPKDDLTEAEVEAFCEDYMWRWRQLSAANPGGVDDPATDRMFVPNLPKSEVQRPARNAREPAPIHEYRKRRRESESDIERSEAQRELSLDTGQASRQMSPQGPAAEAPEPTAEERPEAPGQETTATTAGGTPRETARETPQEVFGPSLQKSAVAGIHPSPASHPAMRSAHPLFRQAGRDDPQKHRPRPRFRTQWVTSG